MIVSEVEPEQLRRLKASPVGQLYLTFLISIKIQQENIVDTLWNCLQTK